MSVIAFDGEIIAADRQMSIGDMPLEGSKLSRRGDVVLGHTGSGGFGPVMEDWYMAGAKPEDFPKSQENGELWARLVVVKDGALSYYERSHKAQFTDSPFVAFGCGSDAAMGALHAGMDAIRAVKAACKCNVYCGMGVDWFNIKTGESGREDV